MRGSLGMTLIINKHDHGHEKHGNIFCSILFGYPFEGYGMEFQDGPKYFAEINKIRLYKMMIHG
jgi:hypothetical protein